MLRDSTINKAIPFSCSASTRRSEHRAPTMQVKQEFASTWQCSRKYVQFQILDGGAACGTSEMHSSLSVHMIRSFFMWSASFKVNSTHQHLLAVCELYRMWHSPTMTRPTFEGVSSTVCKRSQSGATLVSQRSWYCPLRWP
jgi:hypothetical protein